MNTVRLPTVGFLIPLLIAGAAALSAASCGSGDATPGQGGAPSGAGGQGQGAQGGAAGAAPQGSGGAGGVGGAGGQGGQGGQALPDELPDFPPEDLVPTPTGDGLPAPLPGVYTDQGPAPEDGTFRALIGFPIRNAPGLAQAIEDIYDPASASFRDYLTPGEWIAAHAPELLDVHLVRLWLESEGMQVNFTAQNRLLIQFSGTVAQFNQTFQTELHLFERENPQSGNPPFDVYGTLAGLTVPAWVAERIRGIITCDLPASTNALPGEAGQIVVDPPQNVGAARTPAQIAHAYDVDDLHALGHRGEGVRIGVVAGATFKFKDLQSFWQSFGITRADPTVVPTMEPIATRYLETTIDTSWAGALAPAAELVVYEGPDARNTSMVYNFNEAIARGEVDVITDSFAHREDSEPRQVREQYHHAAMMAAALGITVVAASGDSSETDTPSSSPYVTAVGGTVLGLNAMGEVASEAAWSGSGSGVTLSFDLPWWQQGIVTGSNGKRGVVDVALNASPQSGFWTYYLAQWETYGGTSFSSPCFAGIVAVINSYRMSLGLPRVGWLNPALYQVPEVRASFRDIVAGQTPHHASQVGWDYPTGWGAPRAHDLAITLP